MGLIVVEADVAVYRPANASLASADVFPGNESPSTEEETTLFVHEESASEGGSRRAQARKEQGAPRRPLAALTGGLSTHARTPAGGALVLSSSQTPLSSPPPGRQRTPCPPS